MSKPKLLIAGANGMVGSALVRSSKGAYTLLTPSRAELNYLDQLAVRAYLQKHKPD